MNKNGNYPPEIFIFNPLWRIEMGELETTWSTNAELLANLAKKKQGFTETRTEDGWVKHIKYGTPHPLHSDWGECTSHFECCMDLVDSDPAMQEVLTALGMAARLEKRSVLVKKNGVELL